MARNQGIGQKPHFQKFGDWQKVRILVANLPKEADRINHQSLMQVGLKAERLAVKHMANQDLGWKPLNKEYLAKKIAKGGSEKTLIDTSTYFQSITSGVDGRVAMAGVFRKARHPDGRVVADIARDHEFGVKKKNLPARPLWGPVFREVSGWIKKEKFFARRLHDELMKKYG